MTNCIGMLSSSHMLKQSQFAGLALNTQNCTEP